MRVVVVGGGIGGLAAARSMWLAGFDVLALEREAAFGEIGGGVQLGPNATRVLRRLGLGAGLDKIGVTPRSFRLLRWANDEVLSDYDLAGDAERRYGSPYYTVYRPELVELLASGLPEGAVRLGASATDVLIGDRNEVRLADRTVEDTDIVVGADGIHSMVRAATLGDGPARYSRMVAYRAILPWEALPAGTEPVLRSWLGPGRHLTCYPVGAGGRYLQLVAVVPEPISSAESWTALGALDDLRTHFDGWSPGVRALLDAVTGPVYRWALYDRDPLPRWSTAGSTLLGDACHPMLPFMAQGAGQALEDAAALAACLRQNTGDPASALTRYEVARQPHTARIQRLSWANNTSFHLADGPEQQLRDEGLARSRTTEALHWLYENDPEHLPD
ncbi:MAG TPA: FAD-dependent monooxygenase [Pseudonocardia sp.]|jgi:salicylate hydroxylase|uniref:FAD-dependent monooxygenase n=1 Tax=Pseudonocardia sp. TaxID=60912 RepID=UPI002F4012F9